MLAAQRHDEFLVRLLLARLVQHAHVGLAAVERLAGFAEAARQAVVDQGDFQHAFQGVEHRHAAGLAAAVGGDFDFVGGRDVLWGLFSVRLLKGGLVWVFGERGGVLVSCCLLLLLGPLNRGQARVRRGFGDCSLTILNAGIDAFSMYVRPPQRARVDRMSLVVGVV